MKDTTAITAQRALALAQSLSKARELKQFQLSSSSTNYLAGAVTQINQIAQGITSATRIGERVREQRLEVRGKFYMTVPSNATFRVVIFSDKRQVAASSPGVANVLLTDDTVSTYAVEYDDRWIIHKDYSTTLNNCFLNQDVAEDVVWDLPMGNQSAAWSGAAGTTILDRGLYVLITVDTADAASGITKPAIGDVGTLLRFKLSFYDD